MSIVERGGGLAATALATAMFAFASGCGGTSPAASSATTAASTAASTSSSASAVSARLTFFPSVARVKPSGVATLVVGCSGPPSTESCTFSLVLKRDGAGVQVGVLGGRTPGGITGNLKLQLNAAGRRDLAAGTLHVVATGTLTTSAHLATNVRRRLTLKKR